MKEFITLSSGVTHIFDTTENESWKFYHGSGIASDADDLCLILKNLGLHCECDFSTRYGWYVRVKK